jgi:hypothetical protein
LEDITKGGFGFIVVFEYKFYSFWELLADGPN